MQLQMEVCDLDDCDFLETKFIEYEDYTSFIEDGTFNRSREEKQKGIIAMYINDDEKAPKYHYLPLDSSVEEYDEWETKLNEYYNDKPYTWVKNIYWKLEVLSCVLVKRNKSWFNACIDELQELWEIVITEKNTDAYKKRAPKSRATKKLTTNTNEEQFNKGVSLITI